MCSNHLINERKSKNPASPSYVPTIGLPQSNQVKEEDHERLERLKRRQERQKFLPTVTESIQEQGADLERDVDDSTSMDVDIDVIQSAFKADAHHQEMPDSTAILPFQRQISDSAEDLSAIRQTTCDQGTQTIEEDEVEMRTIGTNTDVFEEATEPAFFRSLRLEQFKSMTGVSRDILQFLLYKLGSSLTGSRVLTRRMKLFLCLMKLKLNLPFVVISGLFSITPVTATNTFYEILTPLHDYFKGFVIWFDRGRINARMPISIKRDYPRARVIIDASEVEIERLGSTRARVQTYSSYKSRFTLKFLVGCAPSGEITFLSKAFGGRTTDSEITVRSGFLDYLEPGDFVLADKGFPQIETHLQSTGGILVMPPFKQSGLQFSQRQNNEGYRCASARIHVE